MNDTNLMDRTLRVPQGVVDVVLDTDAYNEIDDQFALAYLLLCPERIHPVAFCAAPFYNSRSSSPADGMEKSYAEIHKILKLMGREELGRCVFRGSTAYLPDEQTPVHSDAAHTIATLAKGYTPQNPLYIVAIGAITNVASAFLLEHDAMVQNTVVVWLGGAAHHMPSAQEFNLSQDIAAARVVFGSGVRMVQLPCAGVVSEFLTTKPELETWLCGKGALCDYLAENTIRETESYASGLPWSRVIWDVTAVAWLLNDNDRWMESRLMPTPTVGYDNQYVFSDDAPMMRYVYHIHRDALFADLFRRLRDEAE